jgi:hypothetical protein
MSVLIGGIALFMLAALIIFFGYARPMKNEYRSFLSPDGKFRVVVFRESMLPSVMPGQSGDSSGIVRLYDDNGKVLQESKVEMVQLVDSVEWEPGNHMY